IYPGPNKRMGRSSYANGGSRLKELQLPDYAGYGVKVPAPGASDALGTQVLGTYLRDVFRLSAKDRNFRLFCPDETSSNKLQNVFDATLRAFELPIIPTDEFLAPDGRVMEILSEHCCEGWLEGYLLTGRHGVFACYEAFISIVDSMMAQYAKWSKMAREIPWRVPVASLNYLLTSHIWEQDHNGYSHQGPTFINMLLTKKASMTRVYLPPDTNCLLSVTDHALRSRGHINLIVASKKAIPQWLDPAAAREHCERGASIWGWASNDEGSPDVVMAAAGDVPTRETLAAVWWLRHEVPDLRVRVVNVVDLLSLDSRGDHPHGMDETAFRELFTNGTDVVFAFHGYPGVIHELVYRRPNPTRFHVRGYMEEGTTTTPFDMTVLNHMSRYDLAIAALQRASRLRSKVADAIQTFQRKLVEHHAYIIANGRDSPEILDWRWDRAVPPDPAAAMTGPR
ncbi:MAG: phosphoketolase family protein, partial [Thermoplasmata archaeon]